MTAYRLRAQIRFRAGNGMADWARDQNLVRLGQAYNLNPGRADEELSRQQSAGDRYTCDLIFPTPALAQDTWNTLLAVCVDGYLLPAAGESYSWMDMHECLHEGVPQPCPKPTWQWTNLAPPV